MKIVPTMATRPIAWLILLGVLLLFLPAFTLSYWTISNFKIEHKMYMDRYQIRETLIHNIHYTTKFFSHESSIGLARILNATLRGNETSFSILQTKVASILLQSLSTNPNLAQISFVGINGVHFSLSSVDDEITAFYTNGTFGSSSSFHKWYTQAISDTGELIGEAKAIAPLNSTILLLNALNSTNFASVVARLSGGPGLLFLNTLTVDRSIGVVSLGFPVKLFSDFFAGANLQGGGLYVATNGGVVVAAEGVISNTSLAAADHGLWCNSNLDSPLLMEIAGNKYEIYCETISLVGVPSVYVMAFPYYGLLTMIHKHNGRVVILLIVTIIVVGLFVVSFMSLAVKSTREKMRLNAQLIKQLETTQQAEKKSNNKSMAIATASHDVRAALSAIVGLIDLCYHEVAPGSELKQSLKQMSSCANDLLALLNSILDTSKIEAGKMQLQETEFNLAQLLEDLADLYHPVGMKKGVEVVLDPCNGSIYSFSNVRGDNGKLKQILSNLLSNAVKFTKEGHVSVRAWARKFSFENSVVEDSNRITTVCCSSLGMFQVKAKRVEADIEDLTKRVKMDPYCIEFVFEVDDTGVGIPKEKHKTVFENFEQVKDSAAEVGGTGLGLGIVRSLVQMMGGDIEIVDKSNYKGTCFRFNIFLVASDHQIRTCPSPIPFNRLPVLNDNVGNSGPVKASPSSPNNSHGSLVILLIQNKGRRKMIQNFLKAQELRVIIAKEAKFLPSIMKKVKNKLIGSSFYSSSDLSPRSCFSSSSSTYRDDNKSIPLTALDGANETVSTKQGRPNLLGINCVLLIVDANAGEFSDLNKLIIDFQKDISMIKCCKVVWLEKPETRNLHFNENNVAQADNIFIKPLHGFRLFQVIRCLPEFGGQLTKSSPKRKRNNTMEVGSTLDPDTSDQKPKPKISSVTNRTYQGEIEEIGSSSSGRSLVKQRSSVASLSTDRRQTEHKLIVDVNNTRTGENAASTSSSSSQKPLHGKKILIVEDNEVQKRIAAKIVSKMGAASVETCRNGKEALDLVCKGLKNQSLSGSLKPPYHCILMDCQMPEMDGFEATKRIRKEEEKYGLVRIPIFALTAHDSGEIRDRMMEAGMDAHLDRPLRENQLVEAISLCGG